MTRTRHKPATYDDLLKVPDHLVAEIIDGELYTSPRPAGAHERAGGGIYSSLRGEFDGRASTWWICFEVELHLSGDVIVPDVSGWRRVRVPEFPVQGTAATIAPDWICEVLSPSTTRNDRLRKLPWYARQGVEYAWMVDPMPRTIEAFHLENGRWMLLGSYGGDERSNIPPFEAIDFPIETLWLPSA